MYDYLHLNDLGELRHTDSSDGIQDTVNHSCVLYIFTVDLLYFVYFNIDKFDFRCSQKI